MLEDIVTRYVADVIPFVRRILILSKHLTACFTMQVRSANIQEFDLRN